MKSFMEYFGCGKYYGTKGVVGNFVVTRLSDILDKIIPFYQKYPVVGVKYLDFADFCKAAEIMKVKGHLTNPPSPLLSYIVPPYIPYNVESWRGGEYFFFFRFLLSPLLSPPFDKWGGTKRERGKKKDSSFSGARRGGKTEGLEQICKIKQNMNSQRL